MLGDVGRAQGAGQAFAGEPYLFRGFLDLLAVAGHHGVDRGADFFRNPLGRARGDVGRRLVEDGKRAFGWCARRRDVFHAATIGAWRGGATHAA